MLAMRNRVKEQLYLWRQHAVMNRVKEGPEAVFTADSEE
jgi:hypothetical protein